MRVLQSGVGNDAFKFGDVKGGRFEDASDLIKAFTENKGIGSLKFIGWQRGTTGDLKYSSDEDATAPVSSAKLSQPTTGTIKRTGVDDRN